MEHNVETSDLPRVGMTTNPRSFGGADYGRLLMPGEAKGDCYARTCPKCGALYHGLQHYDYCPICEESPCPNFISRGYKWI